MIKLIKYIKNRLNEKSTWASIGVGVTSAAAVEEPWSYVLVGVSTLGVLVPTSKGVDNA